MDKRGPRIGDAVSLWNFTPSPGWSKDECQILKLCLMKHGIGAWGQILATGLLPGKLVGQLYGAAQRLLGQQSMAAFSGLQVDIDRVRADNEAKLDEQRKAGLIIWSGRNPTKEMRLEWQREAKEKYGLTPEQLQEVDDQLQEYIQGAIAAGNLSVAASTTAAAGGAAGAVAAAAVEGQPAAAAPQPAGDAAAAAGAAGGVTQTGEEGDGTGYTSEVPPSDMEGPGVPPAAAEAAAATAAAAAAVSTEHLDMMECDLEGLSHEQKCDLLRRLRERLQQLVGRILAARPDLASHVPHYQQQPPAAPSAAEAAALQELLLLTKQPLPVGEPPAAAAPGGVDVHKGQRLHVKQAAAARRTTAPSRARQLPSISSGGKQAPKQRRKRASGGGDEEGEAYDSDQDVVLGSSKRRKKPSGSSSAGGSRRSSGRGGSDVLRAAMEAGIGQLMEMGFSRPKARDALQEFEGDVEAAVEYLMQACM